MDTFVSIAIAIAAIDTPSSRGDFARQAAGGHGWGGPPSPLKKFTMRHMVPPTTPTAGAGPAPPTVPKLMDMRTRPRPLLCTQHQSQFYAGHQTAPISPNISDSRNCLGPVLSRCRSLEFAGRSAGRCRSGPRTIATRACSHTRSATKKSVSFGVRHVT